MHSHTRTHARTHAHTVLEEVDEIKSSVGKML